MFTGIIAAIGTVTAVSPLGADSRLHIATGSLDMSDVRLGDSIAVNGCCLTVIDFAAERFSADVSQETLRCTTLGGLSAGRRVNLEKAMAANSRFGGHIVTGHVDGVGELVTINADGEGKRLRFRVPEPLARYIAAKGSICIDGTSLTVNCVTAAEFEVNIIPHTLEETIIGGYREGHSVNLEVDLVARYLERLLQNNVQSGENPAGIDREFLASHGFSGS